MFHLHTHSLAKESDMVIPDVKGQSYQKNVAEKFCKHSEPTPLHRLALQS